MVVVLWAYPLQLAGAMEKRLLLGPSPEDVDANGLPRGWQPLQFHDIAAQTEYTVGMDAGSSGPTRKNWTVFATFVPDHEVGQTILRPST